MPSVSADAPPEATSSCQASPGLSSLTEQMAREADDRARRSEEMATALRSSHEQSQALIKEATERSRRAEEGSATWQAQQEKHRGVLEVMAQKAEELARQADERSRRSEESANAARQQLEQRHLSTEGLLRQAEERARQADYIASQARDSHLGLKQEVEQLRRLHQEESDAVRRTHQQHQDDLRRESSSRGLDMERHRMELETLRRENEQLRQRHQETSETTRRCQQRQEEALEGVKRLEEDLRREREARQALESSLASLVEKSRQDRSMPEVTKLQFSQLRDEVSSDIAAIRCSITSLESVSKVRVNELEMKMDACYADALKRMSTADRIFYYQGQHSRIVGQPLGNDGERAAESRGLPSGEGSSKGPGEPHRNWPMLRRVA